jgi:UPF0176 protein
MIPNPKPTPGPCPPAGAPPSADAALLSTSAGNPSQVLNISSYLFVELDDLSALRSSIEAQACARSLKGTVLLAREGINLFLAGETTQVRSMVSWLKQDQRLAGLQTKDSYCASIPFKKLKVKVKDEIIRMNHPTIRPQDGRAPAVRAETLRRWLDQGVDDNGRPVITLDTRNAFEVDRGRFDGAVDWRIDKFSDFPRAAHAHRAELEGKTVVSYCTGGIRCEKAAIFLQEAGFSHVYQLEGGILKYLEETDAAHWSGECFVFDDRRGLDAALAPTWTPDPT